MKTTRTTSAEAPKTFPRSLAARATFYSSCVTWPARDVEGGLRPMIEAAVPIQRSTFVRHVTGLPEMEEQLGYERSPRLGLTMARDRHVGYFRSKLHGEPVYFFTWSAIEHVFTFEEVSRG